MPDIIICDPSVDEDWDRFVTRHPYGWVCHLRVWKEILQESFKHMRPCYLCLRQNPNGRIKAALPLYRVNSWITGNRLVSLPFATLCDPLVSSKDEFIVLFDAAKILKEKTDCRYLEVRVFQTGRWVDDCHMSAHCNYKHHYLPLNKSPRELMKSFHRTSIRQRIGKAKKIGLNIYEAKENTAIEEFYRLHVNSRKRLRLPPHPIIFIRNIWLKLRALGLVSLLFAEKDGQNIAAIMCFKFKGRVSVEYSVVDERYMQFNPNHLLFWFAIKKAKYEGYNVFDFGRTHVANKGLNDFKRRWGTKEIELSDIFFPETMTSRLSDHGGLGRKIVTGLCKRAPVKALCNLGNFCYRHLG